MRRKSLIITILTAAILFGVVISGCKRDNRTAMNTRRQSQPRQQDRRYDNNIRPAEVLSVATPRPPRQDGTASFVVDYPVQMVEVAQNTYVLPPATVQPAYTYETYTLPEPTPVYAVYEPQQSSQIMQPPELAMARASLPPPSPAPAVYRPAARITPPIPELEPVRYRTPAPVTNTRPAAEILMSAHSDSQEAQRALAPISPTVSTRDSTKGWVASPTTALRF